MTGVSLAAHVVSLLLFVVLGFMLARCLHRLRTLRKMLRSAGRVGVFEVDWPLKRLQAMAAAAGVGFESSFAVGGVPPCRIDFGGLSELFVASRLIRIRCEGTPTSAQVKVYTSAAVPAIANLLLLGDNITIEIYEENQ